jgi:hypothetical protein
VEAVEAKLNREGVEFIHRTREQPWRQRFLRFHDTDRYVIKSGESLGCLAYRLWEDGICAITIMGAEVVNVAIGKYER